MASRATIERNSIPCPMTGCWIWMASCNGAGHPQSSWRFANSSKPTMITASKAAYLLYRGPVGDDQYVYRTCHSVWCVAPHHLEVRNNSVGKFSGFHQSLTKKILIEKVLVVYPLIGLVPASQVAAELGIGLKSLYKAIDFWVKAGEILPPPAYRHQQLWRLTLAQVKEARQLVGAVPLYQIAQRYGVGKQCLRKTFARFAQSGEIPPQKVRLSRYARALLDLPVVDQAWIEQDRRDEMFEMWWFRSLNRNRLDKVEHV